MPRHGGIGRVAGPLEVRHAERSGSSLKDGLIGELMVYRLESTATRDGVKYLFESHVSPKQVCVTISPADIPNPEDRYLVVTAILIYEPPGWTRTTNGWPKVPERGLKDCLTQRADELAADTRAADWSQPGSATR